MEVKIATKLVAEVVRNSTRNIAEIEKRIESIPQNLGVCFHYWKKKYKL